MNESTTKAEAMESNQLEQNAAKYVNDFLVKSIEAALNDALMIRDEYCEIHYESMCAAELVHNPSFRVLVKRLNGQVENLRHLQSLVIMIKPSMMENGTDAESSTFSEQSRKLVRCIEMLKDMSSHIMRATGIVV